MNQANEPFPGHKGYADVNGLRMYYEIHGEGYPLILIHGGGSTIYTSFGNILPLLSAHNKVIAVEMQAHGHTPDIDRPLSFKQEADDIAALLKYLNIDKANIFGFSNGASTTLEFAVRHSPLANKIIVASAFYKKSGAIDGFFEGMKQASFEHMPQPYKDAFLKINPDTNALYRMYERDVFRMQNFPEMTEEAIAGISCPALIISGDKDVAKHEHLIEMHRLIKQSSLAIFPGGHGNYMGELLSVPNSSIIAGAAAIIQQFLEEQSISF